MHDTSQQEARRNTAPPASHDPIGGIMHYTGTIWRPPYEWDSLLLEATAGCTHRACKFCTLYDELPFKFRGPDMGAIESDLLEVQTLRMSPDAPMMARLLAKRGRKASGAYSSRERTRLHYPRENCWKSPA